MTIKELKEAIKELPDDMKVRVDLDSNDLHNIYRGVTTYEVEIEEFNKGHLQIPVLKNLIMWGGDT